jgi:ATP-dependent Lon protease
MHGLKTEYQSEFLPDLLQHIIETYTREAGVREFERHIAALCRYIAIGSKSEKSELKKDMLEKILGPPLYQNLDRTNKKTVGLATGLAWTPTGGKVLYIECTSMRGMGKLVLTGIIYF